MGATTAARDRRIREGYYETIFVGRGIDIGCADDPITPTCEKFDSIYGHGDAQLMSGIENGAYDYVYSSHCLEHMVDPKSALLRWWELVRAGGHLFVVVPDEDLYEQGVWPSEYNVDHKWTFAIQKDKSWSPVSINVNDLLLSLSNVDCSRIQIYDNGYSYEGGRWDRTLKNAEAHIEMLVKKCLET